MSEASHRHDDLDLTHVDDPEVRRALRDIHQQLTQTLHRQQLEIDAILETLLEKHITSVGEFKRILARLQQDPTRATRLHAAVAPPAHPTPGNHTPR